MRTMWRRCLQTQADAVRNPPPRYAGLATFFRMPFVDMHGDQASLDAVDVGVLGVPYDGGVTSRPGARHGPREVRSQSASAVRHFNQHTGVAPLSLGLQLADIGDSHVTRPFALEAAHSEIEAHFERILGAGVAPLSIGGDHSISLPILRAFGKRRRAAGLPPLALVHIDAHCDTGDDYMGSRFHHGAPFKIAVDEGLIDPRRTIQLGIRGTVGFKEQWAFSYESGMRVMLAEECADLGPAAVLHEVRRVVGDAPTYVSFDIDALDPSHAPGTGTPEIGGLTTQFAQRVLRGLGDAPHGFGCNIVGADLVEVSPPFDVADLTSHAGANLAFELLCVIAQAKLRAQQTSA